MTSDVGLVVERLGPITLLRLNRPAARNALSPVLMVALGQAVLDAEADPDVRVVVLTGTGDRAFCAGMDLRSFAEGERVSDTPGPADDAYLRLMSGATTVPVVGAANGSAVGGGLELLLGCDLVVASSEARFGLPEVRRGLFPGGFGTALAVRIPMAIALELTLTGELIHAARAHEVGLINAVVEPDAVLDTALAYAGQIVAAAPLGIEACRELVRLWPADATRAADRLDHWRSVIFTSEDGLEGAAAFAEGRSPVWRGR